MEKQHSQNAARGLDLLPAYRVHAAPYSGRMQKEVHSRTGEPLTRAGYGRKPYIIATLRDGRQIEGRAAAWTPTLVLAQWVDPEATPEIVARVALQVQSDWLDADQVRRIKRREAVSQDPYDDYQWFSEQGEL